MAQPPQNATVQATTPASGYYQSFPGVMRPVYVPPMGSGKWKYGICDASKRCDICCTACCYGQFMIFGKIGRMLGHFDGGQGVQQNMAMAEIGGIASSAMSNMGGAAGAVGDVGKAAATAYMVQQGMQYREEVRIRSGIPGNGCDDCCVSYCCMSCSLTQMYMQLAECPVDGGRTEKDNRPVVAGQPAAVGMQIPPAQLAPPPGYVAGYPMESAVPAPYAIQPSAPNMIPVPPVKN